MSWNTLRRGLAITLLAASASASAEDIDLFMGLPPPTNAELPNVLIVIDNTANWNDAFEAEMEALASTVSGLPADKIRLGFMMYSESGGDNKNPDGGYVRAGVRTMTAGNKLLYQSLVNSFDKGNDKSNNGKLGLVMSEVSRYFSGGEAYAGANKVKRDFANNVVTDYPASNAVYALPGNPLSSATDTKYASPASSVCQKNFVIFLSNGKSSSNNSDNTTATNHLSIEGGNTATISLTPNGFQSEVADEWARYLANRTSKPVVTYVIDVVPTQTGQYPEDYKALLESMAFQGRGKYFNVGSAGADDLGDRVRAALERIFTEIQSVNSVFASASLPVSVNTQGTYLNQVFIGMFRPDEAPRWKGNLKQYKFLAKVQGSGFALDLVDADGTTAINKNTGFITQCARSFWTPTVGSVEDAYWAYPNSDAGGTCSEATKWFDSPDGDVVEKGAAGFILRATTPTDRVVKTCGTCAPGLLTDFDVDNGAITSAALDPIDPPDATERAKIINWVRGADVKGEDGEVNLTEMRPSALGDVVHSRPVAVDYGGSTGVVVFYGANDGMLHAINGNQTGTQNGKVAGSELWSFVAPEQYGRLKRIYDDSPLVSFPNIVFANNDPDTTPKPKPYFFDGPVTAHKEGSTVQIFATQRRGGRMVYAFDVSTPAEPTLFRLLWRNGCTTPLGDDSGCMTGFAGIGQTWSSAKVFKAEGYASGTTKLPMVIMGGGYDTCEDDEPNSCVDQNGVTVTKGNKVYVMNASTGALLKTFDTDRSVVGDVTVVPNQLTGLAEYAYVADTGGNIYRITIGAALPADWSMVKIAALGCNEPTCPGGVANRKFLFAPEVVVMPQYPLQHAVLVGSGDREHPLLSNTVTRAVPNHFYMVKDRPTDVNWLSSEYSNCDEKDVICLDSLLGFANTDPSNPSQADIDAKKGWYMTLSSSEQVVTSAVVLFGDITFSTHMPEVPELNSCASGLGTARVYNISYLNGSLVGTSDSRFEKISGGGLPPSPVSGLVTVNDPSSTTGGTMTVPFIIGSSKDSPIQVELKSGNSGIVGNKERVYWYIQQ